MTTLREVRDYLSEAGFAVHLDRGGARQIAHTVDRDQFVRAAAKARTDQSARGWVANALERAGLMPSADGGPGTAASKSVPIGGGTGDGGHLASDAHASGGGFPAPASGADSGAALNAGRPGRRDRYKVYGGKAALTWEASETRREGAPTVMLEAAAANGPRDYDWANKIQVQITAGELPQVAAVLLGYLPGTRFANCWEPPRGGAVK